MLWFYGVKLHYDCERSTVPLLLLNWGILYLFSLYNLFINACRHEEKIFCLDYLCFWRFSVRMFCEQVTIGDDALSP